MAAENVYYDLRAGYGRVEVNLQGRDETFVLDGPAIVDRNDGELVAALDENPAVKRSSASSHAERLAEELPFPRTHAELDRLAQRWDVDVPADARTVEAKVTTLARAGVDPAAPPPEQDESAAADNASTGGES